MATTQEYTNAVAAVRAGTATPEQVRLVAKMAKNARFGSAIVQAAQDVKPPQR